MSKTKEDGSIRLSHWDAMRWRELCQMEKASDVSRFARKLWDLFAIDEEGEGMMSQHALPTTIPYILQGIKWQLSRIADAMESRASKEE